MTQVDSDPVETFGLPFLHPVEVSKDKYANFKQEGKVGLIDRDGKASPGKM